VFVCVRCVVVRWIPRYRLRMNGNHTGKAGCIEIYRASDYLEWHSDQPWMLFHELAHAYHHHIGYNRSDVHDHFDTHVVPSGSYDSVLHCRGQKQRHYALTNEHEWFAEMSEAFWGRNDFFPFIRSEFVDFDPSGCALIEKLWTSPDTSP
jgi:hypothetical protein